MHNASGIHVALLAVPETTASTLYGMLDLFASANRDWQMLATGVPGPGAFRTSVVSCRRRPFSAANGVVLRPDAELSAAGNPEIICVPEVLLAPDDEDLARFHAECAWLRDCFAAGSTVASVCSGAFLLAASGLLDGHDATTHWAYCNSMAQRFPKVRVWRDRALVISGEEQRLVMAGGGTSWQDLALYLIARWVGLEEAMRLARIYLVDWHQAGQQPYAALTRSRQVDDAAITAAQEWLAEHYDHPRPVATMATHSGLPERSFKRRFRAATGMSPLEYVHTLRLEEAKQMLEADDASVESIAEAVGYEDAAFFSRLFSRRVGVSPGRYRRRFSGLRAALRRELSAEPRQS